MILKCQMGKRFSITYKIRLYPTKTQSKIMCNTIETCRRLYNNLLEERMNKETDCFAQNRSVTIIRRQDKFLMAVNAQVLQDVVFRLDDACSRFLRGLFAQTTIQAD